MDEAAQILLEAKTIAVVGLSSDVSRPAFGVSQYMQRQGYRIIPVHPRETEVLGEKAYVRLSDIPMPIDVVNVFRRPEAVPPVVDEAIAVHAKAVWLQEGISHPAAEAKAREAGLRVVANRCIYKEHARLRSGAR